MASPFNCACQINPRNRMRNLKQNPSPLPYWGGLKDSIPPGAHHPDRTQLYCAASLFRTSGHRFQSPPSIVINTRQFPPIQAYCLVDNICLLIILINNNNNVAGQLQNLLISVTDEFIIKTATINNLLLRNNTHKLILIIIIYLFIYYILINY